MADVTVAVRPLVDGEIGPVLAVFAGLGTRSREQRFLAPKHRLTVTDLRQLSRVDGVDRVALVAELGDGSPVGIARFVRDPRDSGAADVAVAVVDAWQRRGIGVRLVQALAEHARRTAIVRFGAMMLSDNEGASRLMRHVGRVRPVASAADGAVVEISLGGDRSAAFLGDPPRGIGAPALDRVG